MHGAIQVKFCKIDYHYPYSYKLIILIIVNTEKQGKIHTTIFNILDSNTTEWWMEKCIIGEIFSSSAATF